jgi:aromatic ring-cleaving dioxygenase
LEIHSFCEVFYPFNKASQTGGRRIGYTLTAWKDKASMQHYRNTGPHKEAMQQIANLSKQYKTLVWEAEQLPDWKDAKAKLDEIAFKQLK